MSDAKQPRRLEDIVKSAKQLEQSMKIPRALGEKLSSLQRNVASFTVPEVTLPDMSYMDEIIKAQAEATEAPTARRAVQRIMQEIREFEQTLDEASEVGIRLVTFGQSLVVHVTELSYWQPNLVVFVGNLENKKLVRLFQHISQLSFLLTSVARLEPEKATSYNRLPCA
jgi:hypothetical protein